ncbi:MAG: hypothetical protein K6E54_06935 [Bacteroidaceae bacterium]|nr:hypothetical protein [Bacteroidaceae bacterium]
MKPYRTFLGVLSICMVVFSTLPITVYANNSKEINALLSKGEEAIIKGDKIAAVKYFFTAKNKAEAEDLDSLHCLSLYDIGYCYYSAYENGEALKCFTEALEICRANNLGWILELQILNGIGAVYYDDNNIGKSLEITEKCLEKAKEHNDTIDIYTYSLNIARVHLRIRQYDKVEYYLKLASQNMSSDKDADLMRIKVVRAMMYQRQGKITNLKNLAKEIIHSDKTQNSDKASIYYFLMCIEQDEGNIDQALNYARLSEKYASIKMKPDLYNNISDIYKTKGELYLALAYKDSSKVYIDSLQKVQDKQLTERYKIKIETSKLQAEMDNKIATFTNHRNMLILLLCCVLLLTAIIFTVLRNRLVERMRKNELMAQKLLNEQEEKKMVERQVQETAQIARIQRERMRESLQQKNNELTATSMFVSSRNSLISKLLEELNEHEATRGGDRELQEIIKTLRQQLKENDETDSYMLNFEASNPNFFRNLDKEHPDLLESDKRFLSYVRMRLSNKEIASLLHITPDSCKKRKMRVSAKLGLSSSKELSSYISSL